MNWKIVGQQRQQPATTHTTRLVAKMLRKLANEAGPYLDRSGRWVLVSDNLLHGAADLIERGIR